MTSMQTLSYRAMLFWHLLNLPISTVNAYNANITSSRNFTSICKNFQWTWTASVSEIIFSSLIYIYFILSMGYGWLTVKPLKKTKDTITTKRLIDLSLASLILSNFCYSFLRQKKQNLNILHSDCAWLNKCYVKGCNLRNIKLIYMQQSR